MTDQQINALLKLHTEFKTAHENALNDTVWIEGYAREVEAPIWAEILDALDATLMIDLGIEVTN